MAVGNELAVNLADVNVTRRLRAGIGALGFGLVSAIVLQRLDVAPVVHAALFVPFFVSTNAFFQGVFRTCGFSAWAGRRHTGCGTERIADGVELKSVRARGLKQVGLAVLTAATMTGSFIMVA